MITKIRRSRYFALLGLVAICAFTSMGIFSCQNFQKNTYASLYATGSVYDMGMLTVSVLQKGGAITPEQRVVINKAAITFKATYVSASNAFKAWYLAPSNGKAELQSILQNILFGLTSSFGEWQKVINTFVPNTIQGTIELKPGVVPKAITEKDLPALKGLKGTFPKNSIPIPPDAKKGMDPATIGTVVSVIGLIVQYALPQLATLLENWKKETITVEDIDGLMKLVKDPETY